ncbi:MAG: DUF2336 domain-containing protein [Proteobacteria bacterium]|nr:DUF2336 domain-containing protein [Pseudomonadota bacterium]
MTDESVSKQDETQNPEIESLIGLARQKSQAGRNSIFETVQDLFLQKKDGLSERERRLMSDILRQLIHQVEISVRKDVAARLAKRNDAPKELVLVLANDEIEVAHSLLVNSMVLHDADLIELVRHRAQAHQLAIAMRKSLSEEVSQSLADTGDVGVITKLIENEDAKISESLLDYLVAESKTVDSFQNPLISRRDLPPDLARKMYWWVSAAVRQHIVENFRVDPTEIDNSIEDVVKGRIDADAVERTKPTEAEIAAGEIDSQGKLTEEFLVNLLQDGEVSLFEASFARATKIPLKLARRMLYGPGGEGLAMACKAGGFSVEMFIKLHHLTRQANTASEPPDERDLVRLTDLYDCTRATSVEVLVKRWQRDPDFLHALSQMNAKV